MKKLLVFGSLCVVAGLLLIPLSAAVAPQDDPELVLDDLALSLLPVQVQAQLRKLVAENPEVALTVAGQEKSTPQQLVSFANNGTNRTLLAKLWSMVLKYRVARLSVSIIIYSYTHGTFMLWRTMTWGIKVLKWIKVGILLGFVKYEAPPATPHFSFIADNATRTITVASADSGVLWSNITNIGTGSCNPFPAGNVTAGQQITNCSGEIALYYVPTSVILFDTVFP
jgi:hypothetical protein